MTPLPPDTADFLLPRPAANPLKALPERTEARKYRKGEPETKDRRLDALREEAALAAAKLLAGQEELREVIRSERATREAERDVRERESAGLTSMVAALREELESALTLAKATEAGGLRERRTYRLLLAALVLVLAITAILVATRKGAEPGQPHARQTARVRLPPKKTVDPDTRNSAAERQLSRLSSALEVVPGTSVPAVLRAANQLLAESGRPACTAESGKGEAALLVGPGFVGPGLKAAPGEGLLTTALARCAEAVEKTLRWSPGSNEGK